jgi:RNA polymerase sigma-70 factor, ECF subfamily
VALAQPDPEVLRKAQRGDQDAFAVLMRQYERVVFTYVLRIVRDRQLAEDLTQEIFFRAYRSLRHFSSRSLFTTWLFQLAKNRVIDELRARERRPQRVELEDGPPLRTAEPPAELRETVDAVWRAVGSLNADLKMALLLRDVVGLAYEEIADTLEITLSTVKWRIYVARDRVQRALAEEGLASASPMRAGSSRQVGSARR